MINELIIRNFKCLANYKFEFRRITVLSGSNSVGKSSVIQSILLSKVALDKIHQFKNLSGNVPLVINVPLNGKFALALGSTKEVLTRDAPDNIIAFSLISEINKIKVDLNFKVEDVKDDKYELELLFQGYQSHLPSISDEFYYLNAERIGPRLSYDADQQDYPHVGWQGESTIQIISQKKGDEIVNKNYRGFPGLLDYKLLNQVRSWMDFIIPGFYLDDAQLEGKLKRAHALFSKSSPTNVGFGISYVLPIVVNGLIAKEDSVFIVENPEAHLHPKGQSNIGYFLGVIAASGIQVIIETHSEHVVNGIRRAVMSTNGIGTNDVLVNFFDGLDESRKVVVKKIDVSASGDLSSFPRDFFDQVQQDMAELFLLQRKTKNG